MRAIVFSAAVLLATVVAAPNASQASGSQGGSQSGSQSGGQSGGQSSGQQTQSRAAKCDEERKACYAAKTQTGSYGQRYVPPDAVAECESGYRMCVSGGH